MPYRSSVLSLALVVVACTNEPVAPTRVAIRPHAAAAAADAGPPAPRQFGPDTYAIGMYTGEGVTATGLACDKDETKVRSCNGFLASDVDRARLDVTVQVPQGGGPFPLIVLMHGWAGSKSGDGDIADSLVHDGYAVVRYSARGFGESWGQTNLADQHVEIADLRSVVGQLIDMGKLHLNPDAVAVTGASYGGGHSWLATLQPTWQSPKGSPVRIRTVVPIVPWTDLLYALLPNGRPRNSIDGLGALKLSYVNGLFGSGIRNTPDRPYANYPPYLISWNTVLDATEPSDLDPAYTPIVDGLAGGRSIWWQQSFWSTVATNRIPVFEVQGFTDDLFPLPEAQRMIDALRTIDPTYPITLYLGDIGHPRARNKPAEVNYVLGLIRQWFAYYLKGQGSEPAHIVYAAITRPAATPFDAGDVITAPTIGELSTHTTSYAFDAPATLVNPASDPLGGFVWDPFVMIGAEDLQPYTGTPPDPPEIATSLASYTIAPAGANQLVAGAPTAHLHASTLAPRVQLDVRVYDLAPDGTRQLVTRGTYTADNGLLPIGEADIDIPTYGNLWPLAGDHTLRVDLTNLDTPYITPSRIPSETRISNVRVDIPFR
jgi:ABC-2 type transport system ATP-binding protein